MGNRHVSSAATSAPTEAMLADWENISSGHGAPVWRHRASGEELEEYKYMAQSSKDLSRLRNLFEFRRDRSELVATRFFLDSTKKELCGNHHLVSMFTEKIHVRLNYLRDVPYPDVLHLYSSSLAGFQELFKKVGYFHVDESMIGVNYEGKVKVWLHADYSRDRPDKDANCFTKTESDMVAQVIHLIDRNSHNINQPESIARFLLERPLNFADALAGLNSWAKRHSMPIPDFLTTVVGLIHAGHFSKVSASRRTDSVVRRDNESSRLNHLHGLLTTEEKSHLPPGSKIITTQIQEIVPQVSGLPVGLKAPTEVSAVPIYGHTPIGLRPLSPARVLIQVQAPIPFGHSALEIRPHSPLAGTHNQLHPLLLRQNIPINTSYIHPRDATTSTVIPNILSRNIPTATPKAPIDNQELLALQKRIQSELDRVNQLVSSAQTNRSAEPIQQSNNETSLSLNTSTPLTIPATQNPQKLFTFGTPADLLPKANTTNVIASASEPFKSEASPFKARAEPMTTVKYQTKTLEPSSYQFTSTRTSEPIGIEKSPLSSTTERPNVYLLEQKTTTKATPTQPSYTSATESKDGVTAAQGQTVQTRRYQPSSTSKGYENYKFSTTRVLSPDNPADKYTYTIPSQFKATQIPQANITTINAINSAATATASEGYTFAGNSTTSAAGITNTRDLSSNYLIRKAETSSSSSKPRSTQTTYEFKSTTNAYRVSDPSAATLNRDSQESATQPLSSDGLIKRSFDRSTNYMRISARNSDNQEGVKVLNQS